MPGPKPHFAELDERVERAEKKASALVLGIGLVALLFIGGGAVLLGVINSAMKSSDVFREAVARAGSNPKVVDDLGSPIETGYLPSGSIQTSNDSGRAMLRIELTGPKGEGSLEVQATRAAGRWSYQRLYFISASGRGVDLR